MTTTTPQAAQFNRDYRRMLTSVREALAILETHEGQLDEAWAPHLDRLRTMSDLAADLRWHAEKLSGVE